MIRKIRLIESQKMIMDVEDLDVYNRSMKLLKPIYRLANLLPRDEFRLKDQLTGAAKSVPALITEGFAKRRSVKEFKRYLGMALGSSDEVMTHSRQIKLEPILKIIFSRNSGILSQSGKTNFDVYSQNKRSALGGLAEWPKFPNCRQEGFLK